MGGACGADAEVGGARVMKVSVTVKPNSKKESVSAAEDGSLVVRVNAPPIDGRANERVIELLAEHFGCARSSIELLHGAAGKKKIFRVG
jgi:uncharacterized protein (TIGR00251 family)